MAESSKYGDKRASKRSHMRQSLSSVFGDPLKGFRTPEAARQVSKAIDDESTELEGRIRQISNFSEEPIGDEQDKAALYVRQRQELVEDLEAHLRDARKIVREARRELLPGSHKNELKRALTELDEGHNILLRERTALAADRIRMTYSIFGHPNHVKIGEAYRMAITDNLPEPAGSSYKRKHGRSGTDQSSFRNRIIKSYTTESSEILGTPPELAELWCPVSGKKFVADDVKAAHIVPYSIGETNGAYLFGAEPGEGYDVIWSERNGLLLYHRFETIFDDGRMVIIPDPTDDGEFISIILCQDLLKSTRNVPYMEEPFGAFHKRRLQFQTAARPGKRYLYVHALLALMRRRRYDVPGWEADQAQVFNGQIWATPGKWARKSMVKALALEIGDTWGDVESLEGLQEFPHAKSPEEERKAATVMRFALNRRAGSIHEPDNEEEDSE